MMGRPRKYHTTQERYAAKRLRYHEKHPNARIRCYPTREERHTAREESRRRYNEKHPDAWTIYARNNQEKILAKSALYRVNNKSSIKESNKKYLKAHPEMVSIFSHRRRARKLNSPVNDFTATQWKAMKEQYKHCCAYCNRKMQHLEMDHITPLSKGGSHTLSNIVPACRSCNAHKSAGPILKPVQPMFL